MPKSYINGYHKKEKWKSENLCEMRSIRKRLTLKFYQTQELEYQASKTVYQKEICKAKHESWLSFLGRCTSVSDTSKLARMVTHKKSSPTGLLLNQMAPGLALSQR